jgi:serine/threonine protein kinase
LQRTDEPNRGGTALRGFGTSYYMPHEQALGSRRLDGRSDIYALGATLYHMVTGEVPFPGDTHQEIVDKKAAGQFRPASAVNPQLPAELDAILGRMLARQPEQRYPSATALRADLERSGLARPATSCPSLAPILHGHEPVGEAQHPETRTRPDFALLPDDAESAAGALGWLRRVARLAGPSLMIGAGLVTALLVLLAATGLVIAQALLLD